MKIRMEQDKSSVYLDEDYGEDFCGGYEMEDVTVIGESAKAILITGGQLEDSQEWLPKSQISFTSEVKHKGDEGTLIVSTWIAEEKGFRE